MRVAVLVKQVPQPAELSLVGRRLVRDGVGLETNAYCRRANARAVEVAGEDGEVVVFTMGPPGAEDCLREMVACGATRGVLVSDPALAGSDTLITARVLAAAIAREGRFDLVMTGAYSLDSETGHIGVQLAELLGLPFVGPCRTLELVGGAAIASVEAEGGFVDVEVLLPTVASAAERLCAPSKASAEQIAAVPADRISYLGAADLGLELHEVGEDASPTRVGDALRGLPATSRQQVKTTSIQQAVRLLNELPAASVAPADSGPRLVRPDAAPVWCVLDPTAKESDETLLHAATQIARDAGRPVVAVVGDPIGAVAPGVSLTLCLSGPNAPEDWAAPLCERIELSLPHCVIIEGTNWGREVAARMAARLGWGLVGDAVDLTVENEMIVAWKSAFSGQAMVPITSTSPTLLVTTRPGTLPTALLERAEPGPAIETISTTSRSRVIYSSARDVDTAGRELAGSKRLVVVGGGVPPDEYGALEELRTLLGAGPLGATRRVTDEGWLPRTRQIGITGRAVAPDLLVSIGASGRFNHAVGFSRAGRVVAINCDPDAPIFEQADIGIVGDWREVVAELCAALRSEAGR